MKTSVIEVHDMLSVLSVDEVEKRIGDVPGVESVTVNYAAGSATARYDETRLEIGDIKSAVRQRGVEPAPPAASADEGHKGNTVPGGPPEIPAPAAPKSPPDAPATAGTASAGTPQQGKATPPAAQSTPVAAAPKPSQPTSAAQPAPMSAAPKSAPGATSAAPKASAGGEPQDKTAPDKR